MKYLLWNLTLSVGQIQVTMYWPEHLKQVVENALSLSEITVYYILYAV